MILKKKKKCCVDVKFHTNFLGSYQCRCWFTQGRLVWLPWFHFSVHHSALPILQAQIFLLQYMEKIVKKMVGPVVPSWFLVSSSKSCLSWFCIYTVLGNSQGTRVHWCVLVKVCVVCVPPEIQGKEAHFSNLWSIGKHKLNVVFWLVPPEGLSFFVWRGCSTDFSQGITMVSILCSAGVQVASQLHFEEVETISD